MGQVILVGSKHIIGQGLGLWEAKPKISACANVLPFISDSYPTLSVDNYVIDADFAIVAYGYDG
jgi:hypothetical protein